MSNTPQGRAYPIVEYKEFPNPKHNSDDPETWIHSPKITRRVETPYVIPNGKWVMDYHPYGRLIGVSWEEIEKVVLEDFGDLGKSLLLVSDRPFGFVVTGESGRRRLHYARQIHKGELGYGPEGGPSHRPGYVRQAFPEGMRPSVTNARERRRSNLGWVRLSDLVTATGLDAFDILADYGDFAGHLQYEDGRVVGTLLDIVLANGEYDIAGMEPHVTILDESGRTSILNRYLPNSIWVRRGFANTILRLLALGYDARVPQTA